MIKFNFYKGRTYSQDFTIKGYEDKVDNMFFTVCENVNNKTYSIQKTLSNGGITVVEEGTDENGENYTTYNLTIEATDTDHMKADFDYGFDIAIKSGKKKIQVMTGTLRLNGVYSKTCNGFSEVTMATININENETINVELGEQSSSINTTLKDINYIPSYKEAETERRVNEVNRITNENSREKYIEDFKASVFKGEFNGKDGAIQYTAGSGIKIENNVISATGGASSGGTWGSIEGTLSDQADLQEALNNKANTSDIPTKVSDLNNDSEFITKTVDNLTNYYKKNEIYTQEQVNTLISNVNSFNVEVAQTLPTENIDIHTIYLVPKKAETNDNYDEYIYINNSWEHIGSTSVDLTNYYNKNEIDTKLESKANATDLESKQNTLVSGTNIKTVNNNSLLGKGNINLNNIPVSDTPPENPEDGALWVDTDDEGVIVKVDQEVNSGSTNAVSNSAITNYVNGLNTYSTAETVIGTWVNEDGSKQPLYRKVVPIVISSAVENTIQNIRINHNISNMKFGFIEVTTRDLSIGDSYSYGSSGYINAANNRTQWFLNKTQISASTDRSIDNGTWYISICYTKTTDVPEEV